MRHEDRQLNGTSEPNGHSSRYIERYDHRDPDEVQRALEETRRRIDSTVDQIEHRFSPGEMVDHALSYMRSSGPGEFGHNLTRTIKDNPVPVTLVAVGLAWLAIAENRDEEDLALRRERRRARKAKARDAMDSSRGALRNAKGVVHSATDKVSSAVSGIGGKARSGIDSARDAIGSRGSSDEGYGYGSSDYDEGVRDKARDVKYRARRTSGNLWQTLNDNPVLLGAVGIAVGALMGSTAPTTSTENRLVGEKADDLKRRGRRVAQRAGTVAKEAAVSAKDAAKDTARTTAEREKNDELGQQDSTYNPHSNRIG